MRAFLGTPVGGHDILHDATRVLLQGAPHIRPVPPGSWHATLRFLGDIDPGPVAAALEGIDCHAPIPARFTGLGAFQDARRARVLWMGLQAPAFDGLARQIAARLRALVPPERHDVRPHVTLARAKHPFDARALLRHPVPRWTGTLDEVRLYASRLGPDGPHYETIRTWSLGQV